MIPKYRCPSHPGEILNEDFLKPLKISQEKLAKHLGGSWTQPKLNALIRGKKNITEAIALDLADAFQTTPEFWMNLQSNYDLWHARQNHIPVSPLYQASGF
jgi:addiction module HigA family antidote